MPRGNFADDSDSVGTNLQSERKSRKARRTPSSTWAYGSDTTPLNFYENFPPEDFDPDSIVGSTWPERPAYTDDHTWEAFIPMTLSNAVAFTGAAVISSYETWIHDVPFERFEVLPDDPRSQMATFSNGTINAHSASDQILSLVGNPSPTAFFLSMMAYGGGIATIYHLNQHHDKYQDAALAVGITAAFGVGSIIGEDARSIFLRVLPFSVLAILTVSALAHHVARRYGLIENTGPTKARSIPNTEWEKTKLSATLAEAA